MHRSVRCGCGAASAGATDVKAKMDLGVAAVQLDLKSAEAKLGEMKSAAVDRWKEFEAGVIAATERLHHSLEKAKA